jgi:hypothetical protein
MRQRIPPTPRLAAGHALAPGLLCAIVPTATGSVVDLRNDRGSGVAGGLVDRGTYGVAARDWSLPNAAISADLQFTSGPFTVAALVYRQNNTAAGEYPQLFGQDAYVSETNNQGWLLQLRSSTDGFTGWAFGSFRNASTAGGGGGALTSTLNNVVGDHLIVGTSNGTNLRTLYVDGQANATGSFNVNPLTSAGNMTNISTANVKVPLYYGLAWNRCLSAAEVAYLWSDGISLLSARRNRVGWTAALVAASPVSNPAALLPAM